MPGREPLWTAVRAVGEGLEGAADLSSHDAAAVRVAYRAIDELGSRQGTLSLHELVHAACAAFDYDLTLLSQGPAGLRAWSNVLKIARYAAQYEQIESSDPAAFVDYLKQRSDGAKDRAAAAEAGGDAVRIMTIHSAKGLEFPVVFAADLGAAKLRSPDNVIVAKAGEGERATPVVGIRFKCGDDDESAATALHGRLAEAGQAKDLEEQKRCLYVACTRAQDLLVLSGVSDLGKPAEEVSAMIGWVRETLGDPSASGTVTCGDTEIKVTLASPSEEQEQAAPACVTGDELLFDETKAPQSEAPARDVPQKVSYSALHTHEQCPLSYRVRYELRLGEFRAPSDSRASDFGSAFHAIMQAARGGEAGGGEHRCRHRPLPAWRGGASTAGIGARRLRHVAVRGEARQRGPRGVRGADPNQRRRLCARRQHRRTRLDRRRGARSRLQDRARALRRHRVADGRLRTAGAVLRAGCVRSGRPTGRGGVLLRRAGRTGGELRLQCRGRSRHSRRHRAAHQGDSRAAGNAPARVRP